MFVLTGPACWPFAFCLDNYDIEERVCGAETTDENFVVRDPLERHTKISLAFKGFFKDEATEAEGDDR